MLRTVYVGVREEDVHICMQVLKSDKCDRGPGIGTACVGAGSVLLESGR